MRQRLQGKQLLHQHFLFGKRNDPHSEADADEQHQALWQHTEKPSGSRHNRMVDWVTAQIECLEEQENPQRRNQVACEPGDLTHGRKQLGMYATQLFGLMCNLGSVIFHPHMFHAGTAFSADNETSG